MRTYAHAEHVVNSMRSDRAGTERAKHTVQCRRESWDACADLDNMMWRDGPWQIARTNKVMA
jgi:hypothetical protein